MRKILLYIIATALSVNSFGFNYEQMKRGEFSARSVGGVRSMTDGDSYTTLKGGKIERFAYKNGESLEVVFDASEHKQLGAINGYLFSDDQSKILLTTGRKSIYRHSYTAKHWIWDCNNKTLKPLTSEGSEQVAYFSPDSRKVAFVRDNNLFLVDSESLDLTQITNDGERNSIINGHTDWVYEEEFAYTRAYKFSPDSKKIAYQKFDETDVKEFYMMKFGKENYPEPYIYKYPKAGEKNSIVEVFVYDVDAKRSSKVETSQNKDIYLPRIGWNSKNELYIYKLNRLQNHFQLLLADDKGDCKVIYNEKDDRYVERLDDKSIIFLEDGEEFIVRNEKSGFAHLHLHSVEKGELGEITSGDWEVTQVVDVVDNMVYYMSSEASPLRRDLYSIKLNGKEKKRITGGDGSYSIAPSTDMKYFIQYFSNSTTPLTVTLHDGDGELIRVLENNDKLKARIAKADVPRREFFTLETERGDLLNGYMVKPVDFDSSKKYPVFISQYSGPGSQSVLDRWSLDWCDVLIERGYVVVCVDGRGTGARGEEFRKCTYGQLGKLEVEDQISAAKWLQKQRWVEASRIGIYGWSYGGFTSLGAILKGNDVFSLAVSVAPVTSWRFYDTIYTEVYNGLPQDNPSGYDDNSPIHFADMLKGKLLLIHGTADDNVHVQNSYVMAEALVKAGKRFDMMIYPNDNHSMAPSGSGQVIDKIIDYVVENL